MKRLVTLFFIFLPSCTIDMKFDKDRWNEKDDLFYIYRKEMINDLIENHLTSKMTKNEVAGILGQSNYTETKISELVYKIHEDYGSDIDPIESQTLRVTFNSDSTLEKVYLETWRHLKGTERKDFIVK